MPTAVLYTCAWGGYRLKYKHGRTASSLSITFSGIIISIGEYNNLKKYHLNLFSDVEAQSLQLSTEQLATSLAASSSYLNTSVTDAKYLGLTGLTY